MTQAPPIITSSRVEAYVASALRVLAWLLGAILRLNPVGRSARLQYLLRRAERAVAYFFKQICKGLRLASLVVVNPPVCASADGAVSVADCDFRDSS